MNYEKPDEQLTNAAFEDFKEFPYFRNIPKDGRAIFLTPLFDHVSNEWILLVRVGPNKLQRLLGGEPIQGIYLGFQSADPKKDFEFPLGTFVIQHLSFPGIANDLSALVSDLNNCSAVLEKFLLISNQGESIRDGAHLLLSTELEYLVIVIRSIYDLLQKLSQHAAARIRRIDEPQKRLINLPNSFSQTVLNGDRAKSIQEIMDQYNLPKPLAEFYASETAHFKWLREFRVAIEHYGQSPSTIFELHEGIAISIKNYPWNALPIWQENQDFIRNEHLGSLRAVFIYLVSHILETTSHYANAFTASMSVLPTAIEPGIKCYVRNYFSHHLVSLNSTIKSPWERLKP